MARFPNNSFGFPSRGAPLNYQTQVDAGTLSRFFNAVYAWMAAGLGLTAVVAWYVASQPGLRDMAQHGSMFLIAFVVELAW